MEEKIKKNLVIFSLITSGLKSMDRTVRDYIENQDEKNYNLLGDAFEELLVTDKQVEEYINYAVNDIYDETLELIKSRRNEYFKRKENNK